MAAVGKNTARRKEPAEKDQKSLNQPQTKSISEVIFIVKAAVLLNNVYRVSRPHHRLRGWLQHQAYTALSLDIRSLS